MTAPAFTVLLPVVRPPDLMTLAIESVRRQSRDDFELFVICDGAPRETVSNALEAAERDARIRVLPFAKGERNGEAHRRTALEQARGHWVCQIADDDLWFPDHLEEMGRLLSTVDFGNLLHTFVDVDDRLAVHMADLADAAVRGRMTAEAYNFFGPTVSGYRIDAYRRLPQGWSPAPADLPSDLFMWRKFLQLPGVRVGTRFAITSLHFASSVRPDWPIDRRRDEMARYAALAASNEGRDALRQQALGSLARSCADAERGVARLEKRLEDATRPLAHKENNSDGSGQDLVDRQERLEKAQQRLQRAESDFVESERKLADQRERVADVEQRLRSIEERLLETGKQAIEAVNALSALEDSAPDRLAARLRTLEQAFADSRRSGA